MDKSPEQIKVENILANSSIVWGRYGSDTIEKLAQRIIDALKAGV